MLTEPYYDIGSGEIFKKSCCMAKEQEIANWLINRLIELGYTTQDPSRRVWIRQQKTVIVCLADDFVVCGADRHKTAARWFDSNTIVVTDNYMPHLTDYQILTFPSSYFGVFSYVPELQTFNPTRRFGLSINRMDTQRILVLLELVAASGGVTQLLKHDWVNFNGFDPEVANQNIEGTGSNFCKYLDQISQYIGDRYSNYIPEIIPTLPIRNHNFSIEQAHTSSYLNLIIETYAGNDTITLSEKIFRALVTPAPWMMFGARNAVHYLKTLGFDIVDDLIDHSYDSMIQLYPGIDKISNFIKVADKNYQHLVSVELPSIAGRFQQAADHNQQLLANFQKEWPGDFEKFLLDLNRVL